MENNIIRILLIEDEAFDVRRVEATIAPFYGQMRISDVVADGVSALSLLNRDPDCYDVIVMDYQIAGGMMGEDLIRAIRQIDPTIQIIVITKMTINVTDYSFAHRLLKAGAYWYCTKYPGDIESFIYQPTDFVLSIFNAYEKRMLERERRRSSSKMMRSVEDILKKKEILGNSAFIVNVKDWISKCAETDSTVLITGPSGTGKELVAQNIHYRSRRKYEPFIPINCGGIPPELLESELFGYEKGSFTGATSSRSGHFEAANGGTIFLDEVGELPLEAQVKLLRVIQEGEVEKIGRTRNVRVNVRIIAATNKDLEEEVNAGRFRVDLFYRLNVIHIFMPPLSARRDDIPQYIEHFLRHYAATMKRKVPVLETAAGKMLAEFEWPGNVRELQNVVQRLLFDASPTITAQSVERALGLSRTENCSGAFSLKIPDEAGILPWRQIERKFREEYFRFVRNHSASNADAAKRLGLAPPNFHRMLRELGLL